MDLGDGLLMGLFLARGQGLLIGFGAPGDGVVGELLVAFGER